MAEFELTEQDKYSSTGVEQAHLFERLVTHINSLEERIARLEGQNP